MKRLVAVGREAHGLYILDTYLVKQVQFLKGYSFDSSSPFLTDQSFSSCNNVSKELDFVFLA